MGSLPLLQAKRKSEDKVVIAHISDLHFTASTDRQDRVWKALLDDLSKVPVDLLAVTGDVIDGSVADTLGKAGVQNAFSNVRKYLVEDLCTPLGIDPATSLLVVPGNHDLRLKGLLWKEPQFNEFRHQFGAQCTSRLFPTLGVCLFVFDSNARDRNIKLAINFAMGLVKEGDLIDHSQVVTKTDKEMPELWRSLIKLVLVHHHPMPIAPTEHRSRQLLPIGGTELMLLKNAGLFMEQMVRTKMDLILHGHRHYPAFSRASFPLAEGGEHPIAVVSAGSVGKADDHDRSYNRITIFPTGEILLERRDLRAATYEEGKPPVLIRSYAEARRVRFERLAARFAKVQAMKYVRLESIKEGSGDSMVEETVHDARAFGEAVPFLERVLRSESGIFGDWNYESPPGQKIDWKWIDPPGKPERKGQTLFDPPLHRTPLTFTRRGTTFNAIHFNQRDRLDSTDQKSSEENLTMRTQQAYEELLLQVRFPTTAFPSDFRLQVTDENDRRDYPEEQFTRSGLTRFAGLRTALLRLDSPLPGYHYRVVWDLPRDDVEELNLSASDAGLAAKIISALLDLRKPGNSRAAQVDQSLAHLEKDILSAKTYASPTGEDQLETVVFAYDEGARGLVSAAARGNVRKDLMTRVIKPGKTIVGQAFRRRAEVVFINVPGVQSEALPYYEPDEGLPQHTVIFAVPLFYPIRRGRKIAVLSLASRSNTSGLLCLDTDKAAMLALKEQALVWYAAELAPALGLPPIPLGRPLPNGPGGPSG